MEAGIGRLIQEWRQAQRLSLRTLAARTGLTHTTLGRWESGRFQPRLPELDLVLNALNASVSQRRRALNRMDAPRAVQQIRNDTDAFLPPDIFGALPTGSELLRAMRVRRNRSLEAVAAQVGVHASTLSRWERGTAWPEIEPLHALCIALGAQEEEITALTLRRFAPCLSEHPDPETALAGLHRRCAALDGGSRHPLDEALTDLNALSLIAALRPLVPRSLLARHALTGVYATYGHILSYQRRWGESALMAERAQALEPLVTYGRAAHVTARALVFRGKRLLPAEGIRYLRAEMESYPRERQEGWRAHTAWLMSDMAECLMLAGETEQALTVAKEACRRMQMDPIQRRFRQCDLAKLLVRAGRAEEALPLLPTESWAEGSRYQVEDTLRQAETLIGAGDTAQAHTHLQYATAVIQKYGLDCHRSWADSLSLRL